MLIFIYKLKKNKTIHAYIMCIETKKNLYDNRAYIKLVCSETVSLLIV